MHHHGSLSSLPGLEFEEIGSMDGFQTRGEPADSVVRVQIQVMSGNVVSVAWPAISSSHTVQSHVLSSLRFMGEEVPTHPIFRQDDDVFLLLQDLKENLSPGRIHRLHLDSDINFDDFVLSRWGRLLNVDSLSDQYPQRLGHGELATAVITELTCLDTATTWLAAERFLLTVPRLMFQQVKAVMNAVVDAKSPGGEADETLLITVPLFFAAIAASFALTIVGYVIYSDVLTIAKDDLAKRLFAVTSDLTGGSDSRFVRAFSFAAFLVLVFLSFAHFLSLVITVLS
jgi:hypothetical protein